MITRYLSHLTYIAIC